MIQLGQYNTLKIIRFTDHGAYLDGGEVGELLLPKAYVQADMTVGQEVRVFVYLDQQERLVGTMEQPLAQVGDFACLQVAWTNAFGAFLHWGVMKDLFVPFSEQRIKMQVGRSYLVYIYIDTLTHRIVASAKINRFLKDAPEEYAQGRKVDVLVQEQSPLGFKVVVDNAYRGLVYSDQIRQRLHPGARMKGYVLKRRVDGKLDISLSPLGQERVEQTAALLMKRLVAAGGMLPFSDHSSSEEIEEAFGVSKKTFKQAIGRLYRERRIRIEPNEICLCEEN